METSTRTGEDVLAEEEAMDEMRANIHGKFPHVDFPDPILEPLYFGRLNKRPVNNRKLVLDSRTGTQFDIVSDLYKIVYHEEIVSKLLEALPEEYGKAEITINMYRGGARTGIQALFPNMGDFKVNGSVINPKILLRNSYDRSTNVVFDWGAMETICTNGLIAFVSKEQTRAKHIDGSITKMQLRNSIKRSLEDFSKQHDLWISWAERELSEIQVKTVLEDLPFTDKEQENLMDLPLLNHNGMSLSKMKKNTLWSVNSAATQYAQHEVKGELRREKLDEKIAKSMVSAELKLAA